MEMGFLILFACFVFIEPPAASPQVTPSYVGIFVSSDKTTDRIELSEEGKYFATDSRGTYTVQGGVVHCQEFGSVRTTQRFQINETGLLDSEENQWVRRESLLKYPWQERIPYSLQFQDEESNELLQDLRVDYHLQNPTGEYQSLTVRGLELGESGSMVIDAPRSCGLYLTFEASYVHSGDSSAFLIIRSTDKERTSIVKVKKGRSARGRVVRAETQEPVSNALITPLTVGHHDYFKESKKSVLSGEDGSFTLHGLDRRMGFRVEHHEYQAINQIERDGADDAIGMVFELHAAVSLRGSVKDSSGKPINEASVSISYVNATKTDADGRFELFGLADNSSAILVIEADGFQRFERQIKATEEISVTLLPKPKITIAFPNSEPYHGLNVSAALGVEPFSWACTSTVLDASHQELVLFFEDLESLKTCSRIWVGANPAEFAPWDTVLDLSPDSTLNRFVVKPEFLEGVSISGSIDVGLLNNDKILVKAIPDTKKGNGLDFEDSLTQRQIIGTVQCEVDAEGRFELRHMAQGKGRLVIYGDSITPISKRYVVRNKNVELGKIVLSKRGSLRGSIRFKKEDEDNYCFSTFVVEHREAWWYRSARAPWEPIRFMTDENGEFSVENIPVGPAVVLDRVFGAGMPPKTTFIYEGKTTEVIIDLRGRKE